MKQITVQNLSSVLSTIQLPFVYLLKKKYLANKAFFILPLLLLTPTAKAQFFGPIAYGGTGCPDQTLIQNLRFNGRTIELIPETFSVAAGLDVNRVMDRRSCNLSVPIQIPEGMQVAISTVTYGTYSNGTDGSVAYTQSLFNSGLGTDGDLRISRDLAQGQGSFRVSSLSSGELVWSECGQSTNLRTNIALVARNSSLATINKIYLKLHLRTCPE